MLKFVIYLLNKSKTMFTSYLEFEVVIEITVE